MDGETTPATEETPVAPELPTTNGTAPEVQS